MEVLTGIGDDVVYQTSPVLSRHDSAKFEGLQKPKVHNQIGARQWESISAALPISPVKSNRGNGAALKRYGIDIQQHRIKLKTQLWSATDDKFRAQRQLKMNTFEVRLRLKRLG